MDQFQLTSRGELVLNQFVLNQFQCECTKLVSNCFEISLAHTCEHPVCMIMDKKSVNWYEYTQSDYCLHLPSLHQHRNSRILVSITGTHSLMKVSEVTPNRLKFVNFLASVYKSQP